MAHVSRDRRKRMTSDPDHSGRVYWLRPVARVTASREQVRHGDLPDDLASDHEVDRLGLTQDPRGWILAGDWVRVDLELAELQVKDPVDREPGLGVAVELLGAILGEFSQTSATSTMSAGPGWRCW